MTTKTREINNSDDVIDSRDVIARIEELEGMDSRDDDEAAELATLQSLASDGEGYSDWKYGAQLVRDSYFEDHARELRMDYSSIEFDGVTYWVR